MPKKFEDMVSAIKATLKKDNPKMDEKTLSSKAYAMATSQWKKMTGKAPSREKLKDWRVLEFFVPIDEKVFDEKTDDFIIRGVAINETTTLNNVKYVADELQKSAESFRNVPILLDHKNEVKNIVGRTTANVNFNSVGRRIDFEGKIMDKDIREMIKDGRIQNVSIGAKVDDLLEEADGSKKAVGIKGLEISLVAVPGDNQANLAQAIDYGFHLKEMALNDDGEDEEYDKEEKDEDEEVGEKEHNPKEDEMRKMMKKNHPDWTDADIEDAIKKKGMKKENTDTELNINKEEHMTDEVKEVAPVTALVVESVELSETRKELNAIKEMIAKMQLENAKKELKALEESKKDETKGVVAQEKVETETASDIVVERAEKGKGYSMYGDYGKSTKFKRLGR